MLLDSHSSHNIHRGRLSVHITSRSYALIQLITLTSTLPRTDARAQLLGERLRETRPSIMHSLQSNCNSGLPMQRASDNDRCANPIYVLTLLIARLRLPLSVCFVASTSRLLITSYRPIRFDDKHCDINCTPTSWTHQRIITPSLGRVFIFL